VNSKIILHGVLHQFGDSQTGLQETSSFLFLWFFCPIVLWLLLFLVISGFGVFHRSHTEIANRTFCQPTSCVPAQIRCTNGGRSLSFVLVEHWNCWESVIINIPHSHRLNSWLRSVWRTCMLSDLHAQTVHLISCDKIQKRNRPVASDGSRKSGKENIRLRKTRRERIARKPVVTFEELIG
jgi:hypothetical protein